ncbi:MAG TPA: hypothetical protein VK524_08635 [Polyangiaceae bacterium]|nr:hypothetical protein [Polyangiaceae bacterium]
MRTSLALITLLGYAAVSFGSLAPPARADSFSMAAGMQSEAGQVCFDWSVFPGGAGAFRVEDADCFSKNYIMPLYFRNFYSAGTNRTVQVRGKVPSSSSLMGCTMYVINSNGGIASQASATFPVTGANYGSISLTVNNVLSTSTSFVSCTMIGQTYLLKVDYTP